MKTEKKTSESQLYEKLKKARQSVEDLELDIHLQQRDFEREKSVLESRVEEQIALCGEVKGRLESTCQENVVLVEKVEELIKKGDIQKQHRSQAHRCVFILSLSF